MTDREMIEEMAKLDIEESAGFYSAYINDMRISKNKPLSVSKTIMTFDCPKKYILEAIGIPEDSVVLTKGAYESISSKAKANVVNAVEIRKEMAREIFNDIFELVNNAKYKSSKIFGNSSEYGKGYKTSVNHFNEHILELAKRYGVDIKE